MTSLKLIHTEHTIAMSSSCAKQLSVTVIILYYNVAMVALFATPQSYFSTVIEAAKLTKLSRALAFENSLRASYVDVC